MASIKFNNVYLMDWYSVASKNETKGGIKDYDKIIVDPYFGEKTFERAEMKMQSYTLDKLITHNNLENKIDLLVAGELSNQVAISNYTASKFNIPFLGCYSACASFNESIIILSNMLENKKIKYGIAMTSSHTSVAERQFRYPIEYGSPKLKRSTTTATGCVGVILTNRKTPIKITEATIGKVVDYNITDVNNMGATMAPAAAHTLMDHFNNFNTNSKDYDLIITGDLGRVGSKLFTEILKSNDIKLSNYQDAGSILYKEEDFEVAGSSGPASLPLVVFNKILKSKKNKKILMLATGALHSQTLVNQKENIPSICHAVCLEVQNDIS